MKRIIICESGATKADWRVLEGGMQVFQTFSSGTNVSTMKMDVIASIIRQTADRLPSGNYDGVYFYTAGVVTPPIESEVKEILQGCFGASDIEVKDDLVASARAACGHAPGIAVIMGTGSNSCQWDGEKIVKHVKSGGFIIGDDGSASVLGKLFISDFIKGLVPEEIAAEYAKQFPHEYPDIVEMVYRNPGSPSGWLGSICPFIMSHYSHPYIKQLVDGNIQAFVDRCLKQYNTADYPVGIIGGFGNALRHIISPIFEANGIKIRAFIPAPVEELVKYHCRYPSR
jgi:N-acetylglucosamine kinase-like BadF-type ATPase